MRTGTCWKSWCPGCFGHSQVRCRRGTRYLARGGTLWKGRRQITCRASPKTLPAATSWRCSAYAPLYLLFLGGPALEMECGAGVHAACRLILRAQQESVFFSGRYSARFRSMDILRCCSGGDAGGARRAVGSGIPAVPARVSGAAGHASLSQLCRAGLPGCNPHFPAGASPCPHAAVPFLAWIVHVC